MLKSAKYISQIYIFDKKQFVKTISTNIIFRDERSDAEKYIGEVKKNFDKFSGSKGNNVKKFKNSVSTYNKLDHNRPKIYKKDEFKKVFNYMYFTGNLSCLLDKDSQANIDALLTKRLDHEAKNEILQSINNNKIPSFESLRQFSVLLSRSGDASSVLLIQNIVKQNYISLAEKENNFEHHFCEALFRSGNQGEALQRLSILIENCKGQKRVKETACFLIRMIDLPEVSEDHQRQAYEVAEKFISLRDENKPAVVFLEIAFLSKQNHLYKLADLLLENHPKVLLEREEAVEKIVNKAHIEKDYEILQHLVEILLKYGTKKTLTLALSSQLEVFCFLKNLSRAQELVTYAKLCDIYLSANSMQQYFHLLHDKKKSVSLSSLMNKFGLKNST